jgi:signal transduction histidine-protein kinase arlS
MGMLWGLPGEEGLAYNHSKYSRYNIWSASSNNCPIGTLEVRWRNEAKEISQEKLDHLFDRFYRIDEARNSQGNHYGIGLSIAKAVVEGHKGSIEASSKDGKIRFRVALPKKIKKIKV